MTFLQMLVRLHSETSTAGTAPTGVTSQSGEILDLVNWLIDSWTEIQNMNTTWRWMRSSFTLSTTASDGVYEYGDCIDVDAAAAITRFSTWLLDNPYDPPKIYLTSSGVGAETWLTYIDWESFKMLYKRGTQSDSQPAHISVDPQNRIVLGPVPDDIYTVTGDYRKSAQTLAADDDVPEMPSDYHMLIVFMALEKYGYDQSAQEVLLKAEMEMKKYRGPLKINQLPMPRFGPPLA